MSEITVVPHDDGDHVSADVYRGAMYLGMVLYYARDVRWVGDSVWAALTGAEAEAVRESVARYSGMVGLLKAFQPDACGVKKGGEG